MSLTLLLRRRTPLEASPSPQQIRPIDREAFALKYGMTVEDLATVRGFVEANGLVVGETDLAARSVRVSGTVQQIQAVFGVSIRFFKDVNGVTYRSNDADASLPPELGAIVEHVLGLSERPIAQPRPRPASGVQSIDPIRDVQ